MGLLAAQLIRDVMVASRSSIENETKAVAQSAPSEKHALKLSDDPEASAASSEQAVADLK